MHRIRKLRQRALYAELCQLPARESFERSWSAAMRDNHIQLKPVTQKATVLHVREFSFTSQGKPRPILGHGGYSSPGWPWSVRRGWRSRRHQRRLRREGARWSSRATLRGRLGGRENRRQRCPPPQRLKLIGGVVGGVPDGLVADGAGVSCSDGVQLRMA